MSHSCSVELEKCALRLPTGYKAHMHAAAAVGAREQRQVVHELAEAAERGRGRRGHLRSMRRSRSANSDQCIACYVWPARIPSHPHARQRACEGGSLRA